MHMIRTHQISLRVWISSGFGPDFGTPDTPRWLYTVFDEESESEVKKYKILEPGGEK